MPEDRSAAISRNAVVILAVIASGATLYWLRGILTPLALAVFLAVMIDRFARMLRRILPGMARGADLPVAIVLSIALFGGSAFVIADNATTFVGQLNSYAPRLNALIARAAHMVGIAAPETVDQLFRQLDVTRYLADVARLLQDFVSNALFVFVYLGFIIASRHGFERKIVGLFPQRAERQEAVDAFLAIRDGVEQYLWVQTATGLIIAVGSLITMAAVGLDNAVFWAFLIFIASYIPVIGGLIGILAPPAFALVQFETYWQALTLVVVLNVIQFIVGNVILPRMQGRSLNMDPVVVLLALTFWGAVWGVAGMFLSTPLTVMLMVILAQFSGTRWIAVLLSADGEPDRLRERRPPDSAPETDQPAQSAPPVK
jgi:AI-2 transport protein TqsA